MQGTQITVEFVFISRFTMNNNAQKLQQFWTHNFPSKSYQTRCPIGHSA